MNDDNKLKVKYVGILVLDSTKKFLKISGMIIKKAVYVLWYATKIFFKSIWFVFKSLFKISVAIIGFLWTILTYADKQDKKSAKKSNSTNTIPKIPKKGVKARIRLKGVSNEFEEIIPVTSGESARKIIKKKYGNDAHISTMVVVDI